MHQSDFAVQQENMNFAKTLLILVIFWQFCDANEVTKILKKQVKELKTKYASIKLFMGMYMSFKVHKIDSIEWKCLFGYFATQFLFL